MRVDRYIEYSKEVRDALQSGKPVVALESTTLAHVVPYPQSIEMAHTIRDVIREEGAVPATIAIIKGKIKIGLEERDLELIAKDAEKNGVRRASRKDLPLILAKEGNGATTTAAAMILANLGKIKVFVTGGIGGVHAGVDHTFDVSADLEEMGKTNIAVVCSGFISSLDVGKSLEIMETKGIPVVGYRTNELAGYYSRSTGYPVDFCVNSVEELAKAIRFKWALGLKGGLLVANPVPEEFALKKEITEAAIETALKEAAEKRIRGQELTPYLLTRMIQITGGKSLESSMNLTYSNARLGAQLAKEVLRTLHE